MPKSKREIPKSLQPILWSVNAKNLDLEKDKNYIIHQVLNYGNLDEIKWLFRVYSKEKVRKVFQKEPLKIYDPRTFNFIKIYVLGMRKGPFSPSKYVTTIY